MKVGRLGFMEFRRGWYAYTGSALGHGPTGLMGRIQRHLKKDKKCFWHIDYLLKSEYSSVRAVVYAETEKRCECKIEGEIVEAMDVVPMRRFGSSDCNGGCKSHLHFFIENDFKVITKGIIDVYYHLGLMPKLCTLNYKTFSAEIHEN
ncbi:MAG: DUF123 domain-containing protein [archaeon]|nr:DUF123 domain-containing protein [archaeon]MCP8306648.1 DUF123 domain-containing protein [archaeon]